MVSNLQVLADATLLGILNGCLYALICVGIALIFGVIGTVNFAHAEFMMVAAYLVFFLTGFLGGNSMLAIMLAVPAVGVLGFLLDHFILKRVRHVYGHKLQERELTSLVATMGISFLLANGMFILVGANHVRLPRLVSGATKGFIIGIPNQLIVAGVVAAVVIVGLFLGLKYTRAGRAIRAVRDQPGVVEAFGINRENVYSASFGLAAALAGLAGTLIAPIHYVYPYMGTQYVIKAFVITVLAGLGSINGVLVAALFLAVLESISTTFINSQTGNLLFFVAMVICLLVSPYGLFGRAEVVK